MGIFDKSKKDPLNLTTKGFYFGHAEAEGENKRGTQNLDHYFEDYLSVLPELSDEKFIFVGRKGTGKSAIAKFIKDSSDKAVNSFCDLIKFNDIELEKIVQATPEEDKENIELLIFEWLILARLIRLFIKNDSAIYTNEFKKFKDFISRNAGFLEIDKYHITEIVQSKKLELQIDVLKHVFGSTIGKYINVKSVKAPFYKFVIPLKEIISKVLTYEVFQGKEFFILFDDLDIKFKADDPKATEKLLSLLRVAKELNTTLFKDSKVRVLIFLRDDIKKNLESKDSDTSKLFSSYQIQLNWYDHQNFKLNENQINLKRFINKRIKINFEANNIVFNQTDPWSSLFQEDEYHYQSKSSFKYILDSTFYRPRDLVLFLSAVGKEDYKYPLDFRITKLLLNKYIAESITELKSELSIHLTEAEIKKLFVVCKQISNRLNNTKEEIADLIKTQFLEIEKCNTIFFLLLNYSMLIYRDEVSGKLFFNYRENIQEFSELENMTFSIHKCLYNYFNPPA